MSLMDDSRERKVPEHIERMRHDTDAIQRMVGNLMFREAGTIAITCLNLDCRFHNKQVTAGEVYLMCGLKEISIAPNGVCRQMEEKAE